MKILYASETGNSADVAERIWRKTKRLGIPVKLMNIGDYIVTQLIQEQFVIFVCSTTGQGECPSDMQTFWKFLLRKNLPTDSLNSMFYGVVCLGDSSYDRYNVVGKRLHKRLHQLGAQPLFPAVLCDDQHELGYDAALEPWLQDFVQNVLLVHYPDNKAEYNEDELLPPKYRIRFLENSSTIMENVNGQPANNGQVAKLIENTRITAYDHFQAVHLIKMAIDKKITYAPGDVVVLMPENDLENIKSFSELLNAPLDEEFILVPCDPETLLPKGLPMPCTLRHCIKSFWDIQGIPRRSFFDILWHFSRCDMEKEKLQEFTTAEGQEDLYAYCNRPRRTTIEVLQDFPNTTPYIPIDYMFDLIPSIRPRSFSIASSLSYCPNEIHLLVAVVKYKTKLQKPRTGLCSTWLSKLKPHHDVTIPFTLKQGSIKLPPSINIPTIMVGPGTGCAVFRAFIQERFLNGSKENHLFFGCRYKDKDFLCKEEWLHFAQQDALKLYLAFSRDQDYKIYVQHKMIEEKILLWKLIQNCGAYIYISGNSKNMPDDVKQALVDIFTSEGNMDEKSARKHLQSLESDHRLTTETWS